MIAVQGQYKPRWASFMKEFDCVQHIDNRTVGVPKNNTSENDLSLISFVVYLKMHREVEKLNFLIITVLTSAFCVILIVAKITNCV